MSTAAEPGRGVAAAPRPSAEAPLDVAALRPPFVFRATNKWQCGPYTMGF
jgi:hypothetical protein